MEMCYLPRFTWNELLCVFAWQQRYDGTGWVDVLFPLVSKR